MPDDRTYIRVHDGMDEHPKIEGLSDAAFRALHKCWGYCSRQLTDGRLTDTAWKNRAKTQKVRKELVDAHLVHLPGFECPHEDCPPAEPGHVQMHDYLDHQRSAAEVEELKASRGAGGTYGNHIRWHVRRRQADPQCQFCIANGSQERSVNRSQTDRSPIANGSHSQRQRQNYTPGTTEGGSHVSRGSAPDTPPRFPDHCREHADEPTPGKCGDCADVRKANAVKPRLALVSPPTQKCLIHMTPDLAHCNGCAADRLAGETA